MALSGDGIFAVKSLLELRSLQHVLSFYIKKWKAQGASATSCDSVHTEGTAQPTARSRLPPFPLLPHFLTKQSFTKGVFPHLSSYVWDDFEKGALHLHFLSQNDITFKYHFSHLVISKYLTPSEYCIWIFHFKKSLGWWHQLNRCLAMAGWGSLRWKSVNASQFLVNNTDKPA